MERLDESHLFEYISNSNGITIITYLGFGSTVEVPDMIGGVCVTEIGDKAFKNCKEIEDILLPMTIEVIGIEAFKGCVNLKRVLFPDSLKLISEFAFSGCCKLKCLELPVGLKRIGNNAFEYCRELDYVVIPNSTSEIGDDCFYDCEKIRILCVEGCYAVKYARLNGLDVGRYDKSNRSDKLLYLKNNWDEIKLNYKEQPLRTYLKSAKIEIQDDTVVIFIESGLAFDYFTCQREVIEKLINEIVGQYVPLEVKNISVQ